MRAVVLLLLIVAGAAARAESPYACMATDIDAVAAPAPGHVRFATFNAFLNRSAAGQLASELASPGSPQVAAVAEIVQRVRPDVLVLNEFDHDAGGVAVERFRRHYLELSQNGQDPIEYPFVFLGESNTGIASGLDFDNADSSGDGDSTNDAGDAYGFGFFPGQFGMVLLSRYPLAAHRARTFQTFLWKDMPEALLPDDPGTPAPDDWYSRRELGAFRLSSKSHWDVPVLVHGRSVHALAAHPTPPVFDDPPQFPSGVDFNGRRNHDEIRFWADYVSSNRRDGWYIYDDRGRHGGLGDDPFVILGDYNADPHDGDGTADAIAQLLEHEAIDTSITPAALGGVEDAARSGGANTLHTGNPSLDTGDFNPAAPGNLRVDYVLPSKRGLEPACGGVFWPTAGDAAFALVGEGFPVVSSDHHLVWLDVAVVDSRSEKAPGGPHKGVDPRWGERR